MSAAKTCAPSPASFSTVALPIPDAAPVTTAILPANRIDPFSRFLLPLSLGVKGGASTARCLPLRRRSVDWTRQVDACVKRRSGRRFGGRRGAKRMRSEEHTSELQSLMRISYAVFCLKKKTMTHEYILTTEHTTRTDHSRT